MTEFMIEALKIYIFELINWLKNSFTVVFGYLGFYASVAEPSETIWVVSIAGALLTIIMGRDRNIYSFFTHLCIGVSLGVFGSQILHYYINISQVPLAFISSLFAVEFYFFTQRNFRNSKFTDVLFMFSNKNKNIEK